MEANFKKPALSRAILAALFAGLIATFVALVYDIIYRRITQYDPSFFVNFPSIIFGTLIASLVAGLLFYLCITYIKGGIYVFRIIFLALCVVLAIIAFRSHYGGNLPAFKGFSGLLFGVDVIIGTFIILFIPYFFKHNKMFMD